MLLGESYQAYQVRTSCITQEMRGEALKGDRRCSPCGDNDKLRRDRGEKYMRSCKVNEDTEVERFTQPWLNNSCSLQLCRHLIGSEHLEQPCQSL